MKPEFSKPFDMAAARAGAPYGCRDGREVTVLKWDCRNEEYPIVGVIDSDDEAMSWARDGIYATGSGDSDTDLVMLPLGLIDGKPVFVGDLVLADPRGGPAELTNAFVGMIFPAGHAWKWPAPVKVYPETKMTSPELTDAFDMNKMLIVGLEDVANASLRHAIDAGQVVVADDVEIAKSQAYLDGVHAVNGPARAARDMTIAKAVRDECLSVSAKFNHGSMTTVEAFFKCRGKTSAMDLAAIIATIK